MINYSLIGKTLLHPTKRAILAVFDAGGEGQRFSPSAIATELDEPVVNISYHVRTLAGKSKDSPFSRQPILVEAGTRARRGALEHFYALAPEAQA